VDTTLLLQSIMQSDSYITNPLQHAKPSDGLKHRSTCDPNLHKPAKSKRLISSQDPSCSKAAYFVFETFKITKAECRNDTRSFDNDKNKKNTRTHAQGLSSQVSCLDAILTVQKSRSYGICTIVEHDIDPRLGGQGR
jgi:hypothetical protein